MGGTALLSELDDQAEGRASLDDIDKPQKKYLPAVEKAISTIPRPDSPLNYAVPSNDTTGAVTGFFPTRTPRNGPRAQLPASTPSAADIAGTLTDVATGTGGMVPGDMANPSLGAPMAQGVRELQTPGKRGTGALRVAATGLQAASPLMGPAVLETGAAMEAAPTVGHALLKALPTVAGMGAGYGASEAAGPVSKKLGADPQQQELIKSIAFWAPALAGAMLGPKVGVESSTEGTRAIGTVLGGQAGAGVAVAPESVTLRGKLGPFERSKTFSRGGPAQPGIEPPTIEATPPDPVTQALVQNAAQSQAAERMVQGLPPTPPPPPAPKVSESPIAPSSVKQGRIAPEDIQKFAAAVMPLPPEVRAQAIQEAHQTLSKVLLEQGQKGPVVLPNGQLALIKTPEEAEKQALGVINEAVSAHEKAFTSAGGSAGEKGAAGGDTTAAPVTPGRSRARAAELAKPKEPIVVGRAKLEEIDSQPVGKAVESANAADHNAANSGSSTENDASTATRAASAPPRNSSESTQGVGREPTAGDKGTARSAVSGGGRGVESANEAKNNHVDTSSGELRTTNRMATDTVPAREPANTSGEYSSKAQEIVARRSEAPVQGSANEDELATRSESTGAERPTAAAITKGSKVTLVRDLDVNGKTIPAGTEASITYVHPNNLLARAVTSDGVKISRGIAAFKGVESSHEERGAVAGRNVPAEVKPGAGSEDVRRNDNANVDSPRGESVRESGGNGTTGQPEGAVGKTELTSVPAKAHISELETPRVASDLAAWQPPPELGAFSAPDHGATARADTERRMGGALTRSSAEVAPGKVGEMKVSDLKVAPHKFQYKAGTDAAGTSTLLKDTKVFNPDLAGTISVWRDPADGKTYVINGHHRYELAKRTGQKTVAVRHVVAKDAAEARAVGARQNIGEGRGTPVDAAKFFRDTNVTPEDLEKHGISLGEATASKGLALSKLDESLFNKVVQGDLREGRAVAIGESTSDPAEQKAILSLVERKERGGAKVSDDTLSELIRLVKGSEQTTETTADLFGSQQITRSLALEKAEISAHIKQQLSKDKKLFGFVAKEGRASELARAGNKIDVEKSKEISTGAAQAEEVYNKLSERGGPISSILDESARRLADGDNAGTVKAEAYQRIRAEVSKTLGGSEGKLSERLEAGAGRSEVAEAGTRQQENPVEESPSRYKLGNPFAEKAIAARSKSDRLSKPTAHDAAMEKSFPLGAGFGRPGASKRADASVNRAVEAIEAKKNADYLEGQAKAFDRGEINAQGRHITPESQARSVAREGYQGKRAERVAKAKAELEGKERWQVPAEVYADSTNNMGGGARQLMLGDHREAVEKAMADGKPVPAEVLKDYPELKPAQTEPTLPGMEHVPSERAEANAEQQGKDLTEKLAEPPKSIESKAGEIEQKSPLFRDTEANPQKGLFADESGSFEPGKLGEAASQASGAVGDYLREVALHTHIARDLQRGLETLDTQKQADILRGKQTMEELKLPHADDEAIYHHLENPDDENLTPHQDDVLEKTILPLQDANAELYTELTKGGIPIENYVHRVAKGKGGMLDRIAQGVKAVGQKASLSKSAPQTKHRTYMVLENQSANANMFTGTQRGTFSQQAPQKGDRVVVSVKGGQVTAWRNGELENLGGLSSTEEGKAFEDKDGNLWTLKQATTKEIEANTETKYYHSALASSIASNIQLNSAVRAMRFLEAFKASPEFKAIAFEQGSKGNPPAGWKTTNLPQFAGYAFEPRTAEVLDWYYDRMRQGNVGAIEQVGKFMRVAMLLNPIMHPMNVAASWTMEKGATGMFMPLVSKRAWVAGNKAVRAVVAQNQDFLHALDAGAPLQSHREAVHDITKLFFDQLAEGLGKNESWAMRTAKALGIEHGNLLNILHKFSSKVAWMSNDIFFLQSAYEHQAQGMSLSDALKETGRIIPEYRVPTRILDSPALSKLMTNKWATIFGSYHYSLVKSFGEVAKSALGAQEPPPGRTKAQEVAKGWDRLALLGLVTMALYPILDEMAKKLSGDQHAKVRRSGPFGLIDAVSQVAQKQQSVSTAAQRVVTPAPQTKSMAELAFDREFYSGHQIYDPHADWKTQTEQIGRYLLGEMGQIGQVQKAETTDQKRRFAWQQVGVQMAKTKAEKLATDIAMSKVGTEAENPEDHGTRVLRREVLDQLRKGNTKPLEEARGKGELTHKQVENLRRRARLTPLQDTVHGFTYAEAKRVYDAGSPLEKQELEHTLREKRMNLFKQGRRTEAMAQ